MEVFENKVLRMISGPKREKVGGSLKKLFDEDLWNLYHSPYIIMMVRARRMGCSALERG
jgi:hypothetical protein